MSSDRKSSLADARYWEYVADQAVAKAAMGLLENWQAQRRAHRFVLAITGIVGVDGSIDAKLIIGGPENMGAASIAKAMRWSNELADAVLGAAAAYDPAEAMVPRDVVEIP